MTTAIYRATSESPKPKKSRDSEVDPAPRALEVYCDLLAEREQLLDQKTMQQMLADVVADSLLWGPHAVTVASLSESLTKAMGRLRERPRGALRRSDGTPFMLTGGPVETRNDWLSEKRLHLQPAINYLAVYAQPPAPAATSEQKTAGTKQQKRRDRKGNSPGGRKRLYPEELRKRIIKERRKEERKRRPASLKEWLTEWATNNNLPRCYAKKMYDAEMTAIRRALESQ